MEKEKKKKTIILVIVAVVALLALIIGATYAYFTAQIGSGATSNVNLTTKTTDSLTFQTGANITLGPVTTSNFTNGGSNVSGSTTATATLRANNNTNQASETYNVYLRINENTFHKTSANAELILTITDPNNNAVTSLTGLTYTTVGGVSGFDVTESTGLIQIASNRAISVTGTSNNPKIETWNITLTFVNLGTDQTDNAGASFSAEAIIQKRTISNEKYWNAGFNGYYYSYPLGLYKTSSSGSWQTGNPSPMYDYFEDLQTNYTDFSNRPFYIKTVSTKHNVCLYYNNHEFCLESNFWKNNQNTTLYLLNYMMNSAFGVSQTDSIAYSDYVSVVYNTVFCSAFLNGSVNCGVANSTCTIDANNVASCGQLGHHE